MKIKKHTCTILLILLSLFVRAQQPGIHFDPDFDKNFQVYGGINNACDDARDYYKKANDRTAQYEQDVEEYKNGLFCVDCKRSARQIQDQTHETLTEHLKHTPHHETMPATTQMYADLYKSYRGDFDPLKKEYDQKISECTNGNVKLKNECAEITTQFDNKLSLATANLAKLNKPLSAGDKTRYTNSLNELRSQYTQEINKGNAADPSKLSQIVSSVDDLNTQIASSANTANNATRQNPYAANTSQQASQAGVTTAKSKNDSLYNSNPQAQQKAAYQQAANSYLDAANNSTDPIEKAKNMGLANINATGGGNRAQAVQIQQQISQQQQENNATVNQNLTGLAATLTNLLTKNTSATESEADRNQREQEEAEAEQRRADELARKEEGRQREAAAAAERSRQWNTDLKIWGSYNLSKKTADIAGNVKQAYYIVYERSYNTGKVNVKTYTLNRYSDGTWMMQSDMLSKISFQPYFGNAGVGQLLGAFEDKATAVAALNHIKANVPDAVINNNFLPLTATNTPTGADKDFWNN